MQEGFLSCQSDFEFIENLEETKIAPKAQQTNTQANRDEQLDGIDEAMEEFLEEFEIKEEDIQSQDLKS